MYNPANLVIFLVISLLQQIVGYFNVFNSEAIPLVVG